MLTTSSKGETLVIKKAIQRQLAHWRDLSSQTVNEDMDLEQLKNYQTLIISQVETAIMELEGMLQKWYRTCDAAKVHVVYITIDEATQFLKTVRSIYNSNMAYAHGLQLIKQFPVHIHSSSEGVIQQDFEALVAYLKLTYGKISDISCTKKEYLCLPPTHIMFFVYGMYFLKNPLFSCSLPPPPPPSYPHP